MTKALPLEILDKPKKSLGYGMTFSSARIRPVTGREWVFTATDEQMKVLYEIERLWGTFEGKNYVGVFMELHGIPADPDFDGYKLLVRNVHTGKHVCRFYEGFPESYGFVLGEVLKLYSRLRIIEAALDD
jgi:hypothetical protein